MWFVIYEMCLLHKFDLRLYINTSRTAGDHLSDYEKSTTDEEQRDLE